MARGIGSGLSSPWDVVSAIPSRSLSSLKATSVGSTTTSTAPDSDVKPWKINLLYDGKCSLCMKVCEIVVLGEALLALVSRVRLLAGCTIVAVLYGGKHACVL